MLMVAPRGWTKETTRLETLPRFSTTSRETGRVMDEEEVEKAVIRAGLMALAQRRGFRPATKRRMRGSVRTECSKRAAVTVIM